MKDMYYLLWALPVIFWNIYWLFKYGLGENEFNYLLFPPVLIYNLSGIFALVMYFLT